MVNLVIPAAGAATRLRPLSTNTSKVMVRVNGKPCLDYIIEHANKMAKIDEIVVVDGQFNDIREYCSRRHPTVKVVNQPSLDGPRDAISIGMNALNDTNKPVVVWLGDAIILDETMKLGQDFLLCKDVRNHSDWCMWDGDEFYNKPSHKIKDGVALVGLYSFENGEQASWAFSSTDEYDISHALSLYGKFDKVLTDKWYDIGDLPTYYQTCATLLDMKSREFNRMIYDHDLGTLTKTPDYHNNESVITLQCERLWYKGLTFEQKCFVPRIFDNDSESEITMSFESGTLLSDIMLYENLSASAWEYIIDKLFRIKLNYFSDRCTNQRFKDKFAEQAHEIWDSKTRSRLDDTRLSKKVKVDLWNMACLIARKTYPIQCMHGDLHFGNVLYNQQTDQMKLIDPRGRYGNCVGTEGDNMYDWAKLAHDLYHGYNAMVADVDHNELVKQIFVDKLRQYNLPVKDILDGGLVLLATCIPLHYDDKARQDRFTKYVEKYNYE